MSKKEFAISKQKDEHLEKVMKQKIKLLEFENKEQAKKLNEFKNRTVVPSFTASNISEIEKNSLQFFKFLLVVDDACNSIFYYKKESRVYIEKGLLKVKLEKAFSRMVNSDEIMQVIKKINSKNSIKLGFKPLLDEFVDLDFEIENRVFRGEWVFLNLLYKESSFVKELEGMVKHLKNGIRLKEDASEFEVLNYESVKK